MKRLGLLSLALLVSLPGCWGRKSTKADKKNRPSLVKTDGAQLAENMAIRSFFDEELSEFTAEKEFFVGGNVETLSVDDFLLVEKQELVAADFEVIYFDFDSYQLDQNQEESIKKVVARIKKIIKETQFFADGAQLPMISVGGHSCDSAGNRVYNVILSEKRAKTLRDRFVQEGIPAECIKVVAYGSEVPAIVDGKQVAGDRMAQAPNRRDEVRIIYS
jgi:outer membrane protein OmpA-like peptidoglycan-associated protein